MNCGPTPGMRRRRRLWRWSIARCCHGSRTLQCPARDRRGVRHRALDGAAFGDRSGCFAGHARSGGGETRVTRPACGGRCHGASMASAAADLVLCALTLGHVGDPAAAMREFARDSGAGRHAPAHRFPSCRRRAGLEAHLPPRGAGLRTRKPCLHGGSTA